MKGQKSFVYNIGVAMGRVLYPTFFYCMGFSEKLVTTNIVFK